jgi:ADP-ribose pyrophosphatase YjhB (NUDIX family)
VEGAAEREFAPQWPHLSLLCGAVPFRSKHMSAEQFLLVRRRGDDQWSVPKCGLISRSTMAWTAAREAFDEAGVCGEVAATPLGSYRLLECKHGILSLPTFVEVVLFPLEVETQLDQWPDKRIRERRWFNVHEVRYLIASRPLWHLMSLLEPVAPLSAE